MSGSSLWERERLRAGDLPSLQETLEACDRSLLKRVIIEDFAGRHSCMDDKRRAEMERRLDASLDSMGALRPNKRANKGWVLAPRESFVLDARAATVSWRLHAALVPLRSVAATERIMDALGGCVASYARVKKASKRLDALEGAGFERRRDPAGDGGALGERSYSLAPWEDTLGCKVWLGGDWCCRERYLALASAYWEMTFFGFEYDKVQARMAREKAARLVGSSRPGSADEPGDEGNCRALSSAYGLQPPDRFSSEALERLAQRVAVLNHNALCSFCECLLDLARRMERG